MSNVHFCERHKGAITCKIKHNYIGAVGKGSFEGTNEGTSEGISEGMSEGAFEGATEIDGTLEGELDSFKETDGLDVLEGANEPIDGLLDSDGFTDGDLDGLEEGFVDTDGALEAF